MLNDLPPRARWYTLTVIVLGAATFAWFIREASLQPLVPLLVLVGLSSLTAAFKVHFPIASGSNMSVSYVVDIMALILRGPHDTMIVAAASALSQSTINARSRNPIYRTLFNIACLVMTVQAAGQVYRWLGGTAQPDFSQLPLPLTAMAITYFFMNTIPIALAIALTTNQSAIRVWRTDFVPSAPNYILGAIAAVVVIAVTESSGYWLTFMLAAAFLYLTYKVYRSGAEVEARQGAILAAANDAIITMDPALNIREFNAAAEKMFGHQRTNILGMHMELLLPEADRHAIVPAMEQYLTDGGGPLAGKQLELTGRRADGTEFPAELTVARVSGERKSAITAFVRDITERRALEEQLRQSQKLEAIGRLAGGVAHDFNNILMSIMGSADLLLMELKEGDEARSEATEIKLSVQRGAGLTRQLLAFSRRQATSPRLFDLGEVVSGMEMMLRRLIGPEIEFEIIRPATPARVVADPAQIEQVVLNLAINARDAMPDGGRLTVQVDEVELTESVAAAPVEGQAGRYARLTVQDTGTGIDERTRARLFEPFFTTKEQGKGTGLGLSIVYGIVKQSGGYITVLSEPGHGAMFVIYLPLAATMETAPA